MEFLDQFNDEQAQASFDMSDMQKNKAVCIISYLWILFFLPYVADKNSSFCKFHANQAFDLLLASIALGIVGKIFSFLPVLGGIIQWLISVVCFAAMILLMISAANGKAIRIPFIGELEIFK
ncbi:MAG: hypothetical protein MR836_01795 [Ruminococcus sp.]|nr:hypothetical protein [Ruminococcus sp.]MDD6634342.1 hypothetical protein [Ruminococcus sp.]